MPVIVARGCHRRQPPWHDGRRPMAAPLPRLRPDLDLMPSPLPEQPGLVIRDPYRYSTVDAGGAAAAGALSRVLRRPAGRGRSARHAGPAGRPGDGRRGGQESGEVLARGRLSRRRAVRRAARGAPPGDRRVAGTPRRPRGRGLSRRAGAADGDAARLLRRGAARGRRRTHQGARTGDRGTARQPLRRQRHLRAGLRRAPRRSRRARQGVRDPRDLALRRARSLRADAQTVRHTVRCGANRGRPGRRARPRRRRRP